MRGSRRWLVGIMVVIALLVVVPASYAHHPHPARSGRIVSGVLTTSPSWSCQFAPECAAWLMSGCDPALAGRDPAWLASIVDVRTLADSDRRFRYGVDSVGVVPGGVSIEFWTAGCRRISWARVWPRMPWLGWTAWTHLPVPADAAWMTVTANDKVNLVWELW